MFLKTDGSIDRAKQDELAEKFMALDTLKEGLISLADELEEKVLVTLS